MNAKQLFSTFAIAIISAFVGVMTYSLVKQPDVIKEQVPVQVEHAARYASLPAEPQGGYPDLTFSAEKSVHAVVHVTTKAKSSASHQMMPNHPLFEFFFGPRGFYQEPQQQQPVMGDRKSTRLNSSHVRISYAVFCLK